MLHTNIHRHSVLGQYSFADLMVFSSFLELFSAISEIALKWFPIPQDQDLHLHPASSLLKMHAQILHLESGDPVFCYLEGGERELFDQYGSNLVALDEFRF